MKEIPRRYWRNLDIPLILAVFGLFLLGLFAIYSASASRLLNLNSNPFHYVKRQAIAACVGLVGLITVISIDYRVWRRWTKVGYLFTVLLLGATLVAGKISQGSQRWFSLGGFNLQPSEIAKIVIIVVLPLPENPAASREENNHPFPAYRRPHGLDHSPARFHLHCLCRHCFRHDHTAGGNVRHLGSLPWWIRRRLGSDSPLYYGVVVLLEDYQLRRLLVFLDPYSDPTGSG